MHLINVPTKNSFLLRDMIYHIALKPLSIFVVDSNFYPIKMIYVTK